MQIPCVDWVIIIAEIGVDMSLFVSAAHLAAWARICPGTHQSAGKPRHGKTRKGNVYLKTAPVTATVAAA
jgi:transposase